MGSGLADLVMYGQSPEVDHYGLSRAELVAAPWPTMAEGADIRPLASAIPHTRRSWNEGDHLSFMVIEPHRPLGPSEAPCTRMGLLRRCFHKQPSV